MTETLDIHATVRRQSKSEGTATWKYGVGSGVLSICAFALWAYSVGLIHVYRSGPSGLVAELPIVWWLALVLAVAAVASGLLTKAPCALTMLAPILVFTLVLHGTLLAAEPVPRFGPAYQVAGFADYFKTVGHMNGRLDARMNWFGLLSGAGMAAKAMGVPTTWFLRWSPAMFELSYLLPIKSLGNLYLRSPRARWAVLPLFLVGNWIDQDYFSPQAVALFLYLVVLLICVRTLGAQGSRASLSARISDLGVFRSLAGKLWGALGVPGRAMPLGKSEEVVGPRTRGAALGLVFLLVGVSVASHPLTPVVLCIALLALAFTGRTRLRISWLIASLGVITWTSWVAKDYWIGHLQVVFGGVGNVGGTVAATTSRHIASASFGREMVEGARLTATLAIVLAAALATFLLWRRSGRSWDLVLLAAAPGVIGALVTYGGEVTLRILLFSLPALCLLVASAVDQGGGRRGLILYGGVLILLVALFPLTRYGNEGFETFTPGDIAATEWVYSHVPRGSTILTEDFTETLGMSHVGYYHLSELGPAVLASPRVLKQILPNGPAWIYVTRSQYSETTIYRGFPGNWLKRFEANLAGLPSVRRAYVNSTAAVYYIEFH